MLDLTLDLKLSLDTIKGKKRKWVWHA